MIQQRYGTSAPPDRLAHHLLAGHQPERALAPLLESAKRQLDAGDGRAAASTITTWQVAADRAALAPSDPRRLAGLTVRARSLLYRDDYDAAARVALSIHEQASRSGLPAHEAEALFVLGELAARRGQRTQSSEYLQAARALFQAEAVPAREAAALRAQADLLRSTGAFADALSLAQQALSLSQHFRHERAIADAHLLIGTIAHQQDAHAEAEPALQQALAIYQRRGLRRGVLNTAVALAEVARGKGRLQEADAAYRSAIAEAQRIGSVQAVVLPLNRALIAVERGAYLQANSFVDSVRPRLEELQREPLIAFADVVSLVGLASVGDWFAFDRYMLRAFQLLKRTELADIDLARCAELAGDLAAAKSEAVRAQRAWDLSALQWNSLGQTHRAIDVLAKRDTLR